jgi:hypothetical protein
MLLFTMRLNLKMRQIQYSRFTQPRRMDGVIIDVPAGQRVDQNAEAAALAIEPGDQSIELRGIERKLTAPTRMRSHELLMDPAHGHAESRSGVLAKRTRLLRRLLVKIDMGVVLHVDVLRSLHHRLTPAWESQSGTVATR